MGQFEVTHYPLMCLHFPYVSIMQATPRVAILLTQMRRIVLILIVLAAALAPVGAYAAKSALGDGTLSLDDVDGMVIVAARGGIIGRVDRGVVMIRDLTPNDDSDPAVWGARDLRPGDDGLYVYRGPNIRFRVSGAFRVTIDGRGIDLSVAGNGIATLDADDGLYSTNGADCHKSPASCTAVPSVRQQIAIGVPRVAKLPQPQP